VNGRVVGAVPISGLHAPRTIGTLVDEIAVLLSRAGVTESAAEARDLVAVVAAQNRFWPRVHADDSAPADMVARAHAMANRRATGMPFAYAARRAAFRHLALQVDERVLIPRQETEVLVDLVLSHRNERPGGLVADVGTGSGAIALALATEGHFDRVIATDVAADAIEVARENARALNGKTTAIDYREMAPAAAHRDVYLDKNGKLIEGEGGSLVGA